MDLREIKERLYHNEIRSNSRWKGWKMTRQRGVLHEIQKLLAAMSCGISYIWWRLRLTMCNSEHIGAEARVASNTSSGNSWKRGRHASLERIFAIMRLFNCCGPVWEHVAAVWC
jgi:hypothetical protein